LGCVDIPPAQKPKFGITVHNWEKTEHAKITGTHKVYYSFDDRRLRWWGGGMASDRGCQDGRVIFKWPRVGKNPGFIEKTQPSWGFSSFFQ